MKEVLVGIVNAVENNTKDDKFSLGRLHYKTPHSGPVMIMLRPMKFQNSDIIAHASDLKPLIKTHQKMEKTR